MCGAAVGFVPSLPWGWRAAPGEGVGPSQHYAILRGRRPASRPAAPWAFLLKTSRAWENGEILREVGGLAHMALSRA